MRAQHAYVKIGYNCGIIVNYRVYLALDPSEAKIQGALFVVGGEFRRLVALTISGVQYICTNKLIRTFIHVLPHQPWT
jgi:hypothetical protein